MIQRLAKGPGQILQRAEHFSKGAEQGKHHGWLCTRGTGAGVPKEFRWAGKMLWDLLVSPLCSPMAQLTGAFRLLLLTLVDQTLLTNTLKATSRQQGQVTAQLVKALYKHVC